jgi:hypothetical protein
MISIVAAKQNLEPKFLFAQAAEVVLLTSHMIGCSIVYIPDITSLGGRETSHANILCQFVW